MTAREQYRPIYLLNSTHHAVRIRVRVGLVGADQTVTLRGAAEGDDPGGALISIPDRIDQIWLEVLPLDCSRLP